MENDTPITSPSTSSPARDASDKIRAFAESQGLTITVEFIPFSKSRNRAEKTASLNYKVTLHKAGQARPVIVTDYMQGQAHCPAYVQPVTFQSGKRDQYETGKRIATECETGRACFSRKPILPGLVDVLACLALDAGALESPDFESWAGDFGYDTDSRKALAIYRACVETGLRLRASIGETGLTELQRLVQDY